MNFQICFAPKLPLADLTHPLCIFCKPVPLQFFCASFSCVSFGFVSVGLFFFVFMLLMFDDCINHVAGPLAGAVLAFAENS